MSPNSAASMRSASAMPTAVAMPCPSGPVVVSTPTVCPYSGWPGVFEPTWRKCLRSSIVMSGLAADAGEVEQRIKQHRAVPGRKDEPVAVGPGRARRRRISGSRERARSPFRPRPSAGRDGRFGRFDGVHRKRADRIGHLVMRHNRSHSALPCTARRRGGAFQVDRTCGLIGAAPQRVNETGPAIEQN